MTVTDPDGVTTKLEMPGLTLADAEVDALIAAVVAASEGADWLVLAGSLRRALPVRRHHPRGAVAPWGQRRPHGGRTPGAALRAVVADPLDLIKPNDEELAELAASRWPTARSGREPSAEVAVSSSRSVGAALVTLGPPVPCSSATTGRGGRSRRRTSCVSTVGAGDSSLPATSSPTSPGRRPAGRLLLGAIRRSRGIPPGTQAPTPADPRRRRRPITRHPLTRPPPPTVEVTVSQTITPGLVRLDAPLGTDKAGGHPRARRRVVAQQGRAIDAEALFADAWAREQKD